MSGIWKNWRILIERSFPNAACMPKDPAHSAPSQSHTTSQHTQKPKYSQKLVRKPMCLSVFQPSPESVVQLTQNVTFVDSQLNFTQKRETGIWLATIRPFFS